MPKRLSMIREFQLADWFTLGNAIAGVGAMFSMMAYLQSGDRMHVYVAALLVVVALAFDVLDGRIARWRRTSSALGRELDSLADVISFGVAPAAIGFGCGLRGPIDQLVLACFVGCGVSRLARYNVTAESLSTPDGKVAYFEGTPIPSSLALVLVLTVAAWQGALGDSLWFGSIGIAPFTLHPLVLMYALSGALMISRIRIPKI
jgi:CDP-diacylglycerol--serine O-phosphatidyltransferase